MDIAVVIVTWNNAEVIGGALSSLNADLLSSGLQYEVWIVDSASTDSTLDVIRDGFPQFRLVTCEENIGFGRANNLALRAIGFKGDGPVEDLPKAVYLLNPDTFTHPGATACLFKTLFEDEETGVVGARLSFADGSFQHSAFSFSGSAADMDGVVSHSRELDRGFIQWPLRQILLRFLAAIRSRFYAGRHHDATTRGIAGNRAL